MNDAILHAIFADGCAAAVISGEKPGSAKAKGKFGIVDTHGWLMEGTEDGITLSINENGISCILSKYLPQYIAKNMGGYVESFLGMHNLQKSDMDFWAIHPGGGGSSRRRRTVWGCPRSRRTLVERAVELRQHAVAVRHVRAGTDPERPQGAGQG